MEDTNASPTPRPSVNPRPVTRVPIDDISASPTPRPMSIPVNEPPKEEPKVDVSASVSEGMSLSDLNSKISEDIAADAVMSKKHDSVEPEIDGADNAPETVDTVESKPATIPVSEAPEEQKEKGIPSEPSEPAVALDTKTEAEPAEKKELIPGLNTKLEDDSFKDTPVELNDTSEEKVPEISNDSKDTKDEKTTNGSVTSAVYTQPAKKSRGMVIFIAVLLALALIAGAGYAYLQNTKEVTPTNDAKPAVTTPAPTKDPATAADIDTVNSEIDQTLNKIDDTKDYQENDLTDTTLGL
jgi:hypothetical protein